MLVVERDRVGAIAFARLARDGALHDVVGSRGLPADVVSSRELRACLISTFVPAHVWVTGLAAMWVEGLCAPPLQLDVAGKRGLHLTALDPDPLPIVLHTGPLAGLSTAPGGLRIATVARACIDALAHSPASLALPATASGLRTGATTIGELRASLAAVSRHTTYRTRVADLIRALADL